MAPGCLLCLAILLAAAAPALKSSLSVEVGGGGGRGAAPCPRLFTPSHSVFSYYITTQILISGENRPIGLVPPFLLLLFCRRAQKKGKEKKRKECVLIFQYRSRGK